MLSAKFILATFSTFVTVSAVPGAGAADALGLRSEQASPTITVCNGTVSPPQGCAIISIVSDNCISLTGELSFLNNEISGAQKVQDILMDESGIRMDQRSPERKVS
ncbi:hypothetical protein C8J56DRAFT_1049636 [Mycena floridula]|nr:hypothetical protein C8J56DRAFT_1049636 [Mycena floridula]